MSFGAQQISASASGVLKHRPQLARAADGTVFAVWEEETEGSAAQNGAELHYAWRDAATGSWSAPARIPATERTRWPPPQKATAWCPRIQLDGAGYLHVTYNARVQPTSGIVQTSAYYIVGEDLTGAAPSWTTPVRIEPAGSFFYAAHDLSFLVRADPTGT